MTTAAEFNAHLAKFPHHRIERTSGSRYVTTYYYDQGKMIAQKTTLYTRNKPTGTDFLIYA